MGDAADDAYDRYITSLFDDPTDYQYEEVKLYQWKDGHGRVLNMHQMTTAHIENAMRFADPIKKHELFQTLKDRCGVD